MLLKYIYTLILFLMSISSFFGQNVKLNKDSASVNLYLFYPILSAKSDGFIFNYGIGTDIISKRKHISVSIGVWYFTNNVIEKSVDTSSIKLINYKTDHLNIPLLLHISIYNQKNKTFRIYCNTGLVINIPFNYRTIIINENGGEEHGDINVITKYGMSLRNGIYFNKDISKDIKINFGFIADLLFILDYERQTPTHYNNNYNYKEIGGGAPFGVNCGLEYFF